MHIYLIVVMLSWCSHYYFVSIPFDVHAFLGLGRGDGSDWRFEVYLGEDIVFECSLDSPNANVVSITCAALTHQH